MAPHMTGFIDGNLFKLAPIERSIVMEFMPGRATLTAPEVASRIRYVDQNETEALTVVLDRLVALGYLQHFGDNRYRLNIE